MAAPKFAPFAEPLSVPLALSSRRNWIGWRLVHNPDDPDNPKKMPVVLVPGVSVHDYLKPHAHVSYDEAVAQVGPLRLAGVGFVVTLDCGLIGGDMDKCRDPATGVIEPWAQTIIDRRETYFEVSPSGRGVRFFSLTDVPLRDTIQFKPAGVELYSKLRYLTFTGDRIIGTPLEIARAPYAVETLMKRVADFKAAAKPSTTAGQSTGAPSGSFEDVADRSAYHKSPMGQINQAAMADFDAWVPELLPDAEKTASGGYRVKSRDLDRPLEEDLSISPSGIVDFGVHDLGDARDGKRTPIDIVMEHSDPPKSPEEAATWLGVRVGVPFDAPGTGSSGGLQPSPEDVKAVDDWLAALARLRAASPRPAFAVGAALDMPHGAQRFDPAHTGPMALRPGVTDRLTRGFVASVSSAANAGKSTYLGTQAVAIACERPDVLGLPSLDWCGNVLVVSNEEDANTLTSRWKGVMKAHGLTSGDFRHHLEIWPTRERLRIGRGGGRDRRVTPTPEGVRFVNWLAERAEEGEPVAVLGFDTLISMFEGVDENSAEMDKAMGLLIAVAEAGFIAVDVMQHQGKATGTSETTLGYRGSSAIFAALAEMSTLAPLSAEEGAEFGLDPVLSGRTVRMRGQRQRDGRIGGEWYFLRELLSLPAEDPRAVGVLASKEVAILRPVVLSRTAVGASRDLGLRTLWGVQAGGGLVVRGQGRGGIQTSDWAHNILGRAHGWTQAQSEAALVDWEREGVIETRVGYPDGKHKQRVVEIIKAPSTPNPIPDPF